MRVPARLKDVPRVLLEHAYAQTGGDFSRVIYDNGSLLITNKPYKIPSKASAQPAGTPPKKRAVKRTVAPKLPKEELNRDPVPEGEFVPKVYEQKRVPRKTTVDPEPQLPKHLRPEPVQPHRTRPRPEPVQFSTPAVVNQQPTVRDRLSEAERSATEKLRKPIQMFDGPIPAEFDIEAAWETLDVDRVASSMLAACRNGLPQALPLDMHAEVLALEGIDFELVKASVRNPYYVEIAGVETLAKGYPVLRFARGDITTVVGLRNARIPVIIATYVFSHLQHDRHRVDHMGGGGRGGGGARKASGLPSTPAQVAKRLRQLGAEVAVDELSDKPAPVMFRGQELGKISTQASKNQCESDYQRVIRKMEAITRRG